MLRRLWWSLTGHVPVRQEFVCSPGGYCQGERGHSGPHSWQIPKPASPPPDHAATLVARLESEITFLRIQLVERDKESAALRQEICALADRRLAAELEYLRRAPAPPSANAAAGIPAPHPRGASEVGPFSNHLHGMGALQPDEEPIEEELTQEELQDLTIEREQAARERQALEQAGRG